VRLAHVQLDVSEPVEGGDLAGDLAGLDLWLRHLQVRQRADLDLAAEPVERHARGDMDGGRCKNVARVEHRRHRLQDDVLRRDLHCATDSAESLPRWREEAVVGADEHATVLRLDGDVPVAADVRVDDAEDDRVLCDVGQRVDDEERAREHVERRYEVRQVDNRAGRRDPVHHRVADPDPLARETEIADEHD
jgi:hypothetical protein